MRSRRIMGTLAALALALAAVTASASPALAWSNVQVGEAFSNSTTTLTTQLSTGTTIACTAVSFTVDLDGTTNANDGAVTAGSATGCSTSVSANCAVGVTLGDFDWDVTGFGNGSGFVMVKDAQFVAAFTNGGGACALNGLFVLVEGDVVGAYDDTTGTIAFNGASGLSVTWSNNGGLIGVTASLTGDMTDANSANGTFASLTS
jgi:hypothetical protein